MNFFENLSVCKNLILLSAIPLAGLLYYLRSISGRELANKNTAQQLIHEVLAIEEMSRARTLVRVRITITVNVG